MSAAQDHTNCRANEFCRWSRIMLEHERQHLSKHMSASAFMTAEESAATLHDITDIDCFLAALDPRVRVDERDTAP